MTTQRKLKKTVRFIIFTLSLIFSAQISEAAYMALQNTPYDMQMRPIKTVLHQPTNAGVQVNYTEVMKWMRQISNYRYSDTDIWHTPQQTEKRRAGDCKDKAVLLLSYFKEKGCANVKLVIGKKTPKSKVTHAWVEWKHNGEWIILDPTIGRKPILKHRKGEYAKQYIFMGAKKYSYISPDNLLAGL